jgi:hypothetical protein
MNHAAESAGCATETAQQALAAAAAEDAISAVFGTLLADADAPLLAPPAAQDPANLSLLYHVSAVSRHDWVGSPWLKVLNMLLAP